MRKQILLFVLLNTYESITYAIDRHSVIDVVETTNHDTSVVDTDVDHTIHRRATTRTRQALASIQSSSTTSRSCDSNPFDLFNDESILAENEDALVRALGSKYSSLPTHKPTGKGVSDIIVYVYHAYTRSI